MKKVRLATVALSLLILLAGCGTGQETFEIKKYLKQNYGTEEFTIKKNKGDSPRSYDVFLNEVPDIHFTLTKEAGGSFDDDYTEQVLQGQMDNLGLAWERVADYHIQVSYKDYASIDETVKKIEEFIKICENTHAFKPIKEICVLTLRPESPPDPLYPGYQIRLSDNGYSVYPGYKGPDDRFYLKAAHLEPGKLAGEVRLCHIYYQYQFTMNPDVSEFTEEDMERYYELSCGVTGTANDGIETVYAEADITDHDFTFGSAYQILKADGLITDVGENRFTAAANGRTVEFIITFTQEGPVSAYTVFEEGEADIDWEDDPLYGLYEEELRTEVERLTGKWFSDTTPEKIAAKKEEERLARLPDIQSCFAGASAVGETAFVHNTQFTVLSAKRCSSIGSGSFNYQAPNGKTCLLVRIRAENKGTVPADLFSWVISSEDDYSGIISDKEANVYEPVDIIAVSFDDIYMTLEPGGIAEGDVLFIISEELAAVPEELIFIVFNAAHQYTGFQLPNEINKGDFYECLGYFRRVDDKLGEKT